MDEKANYSKESTTKSKQEESTAGNQKDVKDSLSDFDDTIERTEQMKVTIERLEARPTRQLLQHYLKTNRLLAAFVCNLCHELVRGGVITICGHLYCWACLWPQLKVQMHKPRCPRCKYKLILHEDLVPFLGEGPHDEWAYNAEVVAQPDNVARPAGMYLANDKFPDWFFVLPTDVIQQRVERNLYLIESLLQVDSSGISTCIRVLKWIQYVCVILLVLVFFLLIGY